MPRKETTSRSFAGHLMHLCTTQSTRAEKPLQTFNQSRKLLQSKLGSLVTQLKYLTANIKLWLVKTQAVSLPQAQRSCLSLFCCPTSCKQLAVLVRTHFAHFSERRGMFVLGTQRLICSELAAARADTGWRQREKGANKSYFPQDCS